MPFKRRTLMVVGIGVSLLAVLVLVAPFLIDAERFRPAIESKLTAAIGREVHIGSLHFSWLAGGIEARDVSIADDPAFSRKPFFLARALDVHVELRPLLLNREVRILSLSARQPSVTLIRNGERWNFSSLGAQSASSAPAGSGQAATPIQLKKLTIAAGQIVVVEPARTQTYSDVNFTVSDFSPGSAFPFTLGSTLPGNGKLRIEGKAGPLPPSDMAESPVEATFKLERVPLGSYAAAGSGLQGELGLTGEFRSDGRRAQVEGKSRIEKLVLQRGGTPLPHAVDLQFAANYNLKTQAAQLSRADLRVGKSEAHLKGQIDLRNRPLLNLTISTPGLQATDVEAILKAMAIALPGGASLQGGTASANLAINGPAGALVITGPLNVQDLTVRGFDLGAKVRSVAMLAGIKTGQDTHIQSLDSRLRIAPEGMRFDDIKTVVDGFGSLDGAGAVGAKNDLDFRLTAHLAQGGGLLGGILQAAKLGQLSTVPFKILGTTADPKFLPDMNSILQTNQNQSQNQTQTQQPNQLGGMLQQLLNRGKKK